MARYCMKYESGLLTEVSGDDIETATESASEKALSGDYLAKLQLIEIQSDKIIALRQDANSQWELVNE